jgi:YbbR domain-containing protein
MYLWFRLVRVRIMNMDHRKIFIENWGLKLVSLVLALMLWVYVTSKGKTELTLTVPIEFRNIPQGMAIVGEVAGTLEVRVQGQERDLRDITSGKKVTGILDLSRAVAGENIIRISPDDINRPARVAVTRISPFEVWVKLEHLIRKTVRLRPRLRGAPADGYALAGVSVKPQRITIEGTVDVLQELGSIETLPIDIEGSRENVTIEPKIDYGGKPIRILEKDMTVRVFIKRVEK